MGRYVDAGTDRGNRGRSLVLLEPVVVERSVHVGQDLEALNDLVEITEFEVFGVVEESSCELDEAMPGTRVGGGLGERSTWAVPM